MLVLTKLRVQIVQVIYYYFSFLLPELFITLTAYVTEFDHSPQWNLAVSELIFYYHRRNKRGIYLTLLKEFENALSRPYSILPLIRPSIFANAVNRIDYAHQSQLIRDNVVQISDTLLTRASSLYGDGEEAVLREGITKKSLTKNNRLLANDILLDLDEDEEADISDNTFGEVFSCVGSRNGDAMNREAYTLSLTAMTVKKLKELAETNGLKSISKMSKGQLVEAIVTKRFK